MAATMPWIMFLGDFILTPHSVAGEGFELPTCRFLNPQLLPPELLLVTRIGSETWVIHEPTELCLTALPRIISPHRPASLIGVGFLRFFTGGINSPPIISILFSFTKINPKSNFLARYIMLCILDFHSIGTAKKDCFVW